MNANSEHSIFEISYRRRNYSIYTAILPVITSCAFSLLLPIPLYYSGEGSIHVGFCEKDLAVNTGLVHVEGLDDEPNGPKYYGLLLGCSLSLMPRFISQTS